MVCFAALMSCSGKQKGTFIGCEAICEKLEDLDCPGMVASSGEDGVEGTGDDIPCIVVCSKIINGPAFWMDEQCVLKADDCYQLELCDE
jgi:hypothetical protein